MSVPLDARANVKLIQFYEIFRGIEYAAGSFPRNLKLNQPGVERVIDSLVAFTYLYNTKAYPFIQANLGIASIPRSGVARKLGLIPLQELKSEDCDLSLLITGCGFLPAEQGTPFKYISAKLAQRVSDPTESTAVQAVPIARITPGELNIQVPPSSTDVKKEKYLPTDFAFMSLAFINTLR